MGRTGDKDGKKPPPSGLTQEDHALWREVTRDARPLKSAKLSESAKKQTDPSEAPRTAGKHPAKAKKAAAPPGKPTGPPAKPPRPTPPDLSHGSVAGLDKRKANQLKKGRLVIEGRLDLHGMHQSRAHDVLLRFVTESQLSGKRCVLVITGKGGPKGRDGTEGGILRQAVPRWLNEPALRQKILSFDYAQPKDGGTGALYILLKRNRTKS